MKYLVFVCLIFTTCFSSAAGRLSLCDGCGGGPVPPLALPPVFTVVCSVNHDIASRLGLYDLEFPTSKKIKLNKTELQANLLLSKALAGDQAECFLKYTPLPPSPF